LSHFVAKLLVGDHLWSFYVTVLLKQQYVIALANDKEFDLPNSVVEWMALLLRILEAPPSDLGLETSYRDWDFSFVFPIVPLGKCREITSN
jgi:hypothetical protein